MLPGDVAELKLLPATSNWRNSANDKALDVNE